MKNKINSIFIVTSIFITSCTTLDKAILGMPLERSITPESVKNYNTPQELINGEILNGTDNLGKLYKPSLNQMRIPYKYFESLCIAQGKNLNTINAYPDPWIGSFECKGGNSWAVKIHEVKRTSEGSYLVSSLISNSDLRNQVIISSERELEKRRMIQEEQEKIRAQQQLYQLNVKNNAPKLNDIGATICKDTQVREYTGTVVMGQPYYRYVPNAKVIANLEGFGNSNQNIKINIKGWLNRDNGISSGSNVLYNQTPLESGKLIWDVKQNWYKCNY